MRKLTILTLFTLLIVSSALDCNVTLPRLLIGEKYANMQSNETALIVFDTKDDCSDVVNLIPGKNTPFNFTLKKPEHLLVVKANLSHNGQNSEIVDINKYTMIFAFHGDVQKQYNVSFQGNKSDPASIFPTSYNFTLPKLGAQSQSQKADGLKFMFFGDSDLTQRGNVTLDNLFNSLQKNQFDAFFFLGDYAYEFYQNNGQKGDAYVERLSPLSFNYPLVMAPGNHEDNLNFTIFNKKFFLPQYQNNLNKYNSFNIGNVHFIHINLHFYGITTQDEQTKMINWVKNDLASVNRSITPWVIAFSHKLIYCYEEFKNNADCIGYAKQFQVFDTLLAQYGVDIFLVAHQHYNQLMAPMAYNTIQQYEYDQNTSIIKKSKGYLTLIQGNGGCAVKPPLLLNQKRMLASFPDNLKDANLFLDEQTIGYGYIEIKNDTHLEYTSYDSQNDRVLRKFIISSTHESLQPSFSSIISYSVLFIVALIAAL